ncbi:MAG TPA: signal peptide peptidase SppA [Vicinamibacterales bacterium]|nr:signal peptide peptidase SppA [Vicinamibacterales bacterium]
MSASRGVRFVLGLLLVATFISVAAMTLMYLALGRSPTIASSSTLVLRPSGDLPELIPEVILPIGGGQHLTVRGYVDVIRKAKQDRRVARLLIKPGGLESPFWAKVQEVRDAIVDFRRSGKPVYAFLEYGGGKEYYLASAADKVYLLPTSTLDLTGLPSYEVFLRGTFDWVGTYPDFLHVGDYKTAVNTFTEKGFTPAHREMSESLNQDQFDQLVRGIADGRRKPEDEVRALIDRGPFQPEEALRVGLVDDLAYEDELDDVADVTLDAQIEVENYARVTWEALGVSRRARIAVVNAVGTMVSGESGFDPINGPVLGSDSLVEQIREARGSGAKALVLRIDSPGGSSVASDVIWRELMITKDKGLPVIVSMSDLAASGGYYMAAAGDVIVAQPGTLTGSIGVYTGKFVTGGTFEKLGANIETVRQGKFADMYSPDRPFTQEERTKVLESMQATYDHFVERVADARQMTPEKVDQIGQGRVWTGRQAREVGLVDELGGLMAAVAVAKQRAKIPAEEEVQLDIYPRTRSFYEVLSNQFQSPIGQLRARSTAETLISLLGPRDRDILAALLAPSRLFRAGELLAHMPYVFVR